MEELAPVMAMFAFFGAIAWIIKITLSHRRQTKMFQVQSEMQSRLLDKFGTSQELLEYLSSDAGLRFLQSATIEKTNPFRRILASIQAGIVLGMGGAAFLFIRGVFPDADAQAGLVFVGGLGLALGIGFALSGAVAYFLSKSWGLINGDKDVMGESQ